MSINTCASQDGLGVVLFYGERLLITYDGCKLTISGSGKQPKGSFTGRAFLTSHRVMFLSKDRSKNIVSFSMPFIYMKGVAIKQPTFGPNHIEGFVKPEQNHWQGELPFKLAFNHGGAIEFGKCLLELGTRASKLRESYRVPTAPPSCDIYACPPPAYTPFATDAYYSSFMQYHPAFSPAPADQLYQTTEPPPYPGAVPPSYASGVPDAPPPTYGATAAPYPDAGYPPAYPPPNGAMGGPGYPPAVASPGAYPPNPNPQNAATTGYFHNQDPHTVYAPPYVNASAPPMEPEDKKNI